MLISDYGVGAGSCTATVLTKTLLITAGHCVYSHELGMWAQAVRFVPELTWDDPSDPTSMTIPRGIWDASRWWVPQGFINGDYGLDFALVEIGGRNSAGQTIGDLEGTWSATWNIRYGSGARIYIAGYPQAGFWSTNAGFNGRGEYACDTSYGGDYSVEGSGYQMWVTCTMNQGASGGPWFVALSDGTWTIGSVSSMCFGGNVDSEGKPCQPYSNALRGIYFNDSFGQFWHGVVG